MLNIRFQQYNIVFFLFLLSVTGCTLSKEGPIYSQPQEINESISLNSYNINVIDSRKVKNKNPISIPMMTLGGEYSKATPNVLEKVKLEFRSVIESFKTEGSRNLLFEIQVLESFQEFRSDGQKETEYAHSKIKIIVSNNNGEYLGSGEGESWGMKKLLDASEESIELMLNQTIKLSIYRALNNINWG